MAWCTIPRRTLVASAKPMCTVDKVLNQRVDWARYSARDAIDNASSASHVNGAFVSNVSAHARGGWMSPFRRLGQ